MTETLEIEPFDPTMMDAVIQLSLRAWEPVFASMEDGMDPAVFRSFYPDGWRETQSAVVRDTCSNDEIDTRVAIVSGVVAGFVATKVQEDRVMGEVYMIAVDPDYQRRGIGVRLTDDAVDRLRSEGVSVVMVETGGDPGHGPARGLYERTGFRVFPIARYFRSV